MQDLFIYLQYNMLDFNNILSTPGMDVQYFTGQGGIIGSIASVTIAASPAGVLTVTSSAASGGYLVGQAITVSGTLSAGTINGTADFTTPVTFYIIRVDSATSIRISDTPGGTAVAVTAGTATPGGVFTLSSQWQTWRKPRGVKNIYILGVGGGSSGAVGDNTGGTNAGGGGGGSAGQTCVWMPAFFVPDVLYIQCGAGGQHPTTLVGGQIQQGGGPTYVCIEPSTTLTPNMTVLLANGGVGGAVTGGALATIAGMPLAARGYYTFFVGHSGTAGGAAQTAGTNLTFPVTGIMVMGGSGGGGSGAAPGAGGALSVPLGQPYNDFFLFTYPGGTAASGATPAGAGFSGAVMRNFIMNYSGMGGGGASTTSGGVAGAGGNGAPGSGGGGSGGATNTITTALARPGNGGNGFVIIMSW